jgi:large subunit ribosomal protein L31
MKADIHPDYHYVVFNDLASGEKFITRSTVTSEKTIEWEDGNTYPVVDVEISSASHPFYTGKQRIMDSAGRVETYKTRYAMFGKTAYGPHELTRAAAPLARPPLCFSRPGGVMPRFAAASPGLP